LVGYHLTIILKGSTEMRSYGIEWIDTTQY